MKKLIFIWIVIVFPWISCPVHGQMAGTDEYPQIAAQWVRMVIDRDGQWAGSETPQPGHVQEFRSGDRLLGYYCEVKPMGFIVMSLRKELAPVKAWSDENDIDPLADEGMPGLLKTCLARLIDTIESRLGPIALADPQKVDEMTEIKYREVWENVAGYIPGTLKKQEGPKDNYQEGEVLLTSVWHQGPPYNNQCPYMGCTNTSNGNAIVGCVATAGAQIMRYWCWPPYGAYPFNDTYDWPNMPDDATTSSPTVQQNAVAEISHEVGVAVGMNYGCTSSGAYTYDMVGVYKNYFVYHSSVGTMSRPLYDAITWFTHFKNNINVNRPVQYRIPGHSIVGDGWREGGNPYVREYHMNYGWGNGSANAWYILDALQGGNPAEEYMVVNIVPSVAIGANLSGTYTLPAFPYRYFDLDASGSSATFNSGHQLQILPGLTITGTGSSTFVRVYGSSGYYSRIFAHGDAGYGMLIRDGAVRLSHAGSIKLH
ncbi:MAG: C10 family peptidase [Bacteroidales bacterium]|nr:C10 family peptidase [Bacteroidales bacterium]